MVVGADVKEIEEGSHDIGRIDPIETNSRSQNSYALSKLQRGHGSQSLEAATVCRGVRKDLSL
jgi:hypothetical protein